MIKIFILIISFNLSVYANYFNPKSYNTNKYKKQNNIEYNNNKRNNKEILEKKYLNYLKI